MVLNFILKLVKFYFKIGEIVWLDLWSGFVTCMIAMCSTVTTNVAPSVSQSDEIVNIFSSVLVATALRKVKPSHSCGPDGLPSVLYNKLCKSLVQPLSLISESFMSIGKVYRMNGALQL